ncbi:MAG: helix-turn-helix domain-containing protein [Parasporobacterium sp.]|nr:helix-turn-helix domain-containing protein [Parasporobacterium sp.]
MNAMIVDDEAVAAAAMKRRIDWPKYGIDQVYMAESMRQAIRIMEEETVDLMLCDVEMPGGSGLELYEWVRTYRPEIECVFVSCHPEYEYVRKALIMGSMDYVLKPVDYEEMDRILTEAAQRIRDAFARNREKQKAAAEGISAVSAQPEDFREESDSSRVFPDTIQNAISYMETHLETNMSISEIAEEVHLNPQYFMRLFKKETGKPVLEYITERRLEKARKLLADTSLPITEVALAAGYDNFSYFSKLFKRNEGQTPSEYRRRCRS